MNTMIAPTAVSTGRPNAGPHWKLAATEDRHASEAEVRPLQVRMVGKLTACDTPGGGEVQQQETEKYLNELGIEARAWRPWEEGFDQFDVLHLFGSRPEFVELAASASRHNVKVVLSPITWFDPAAYWQEARPLVRRILACMNHFARGACPSLPSWRRRLYHAVDLLLPNSQAEANQLQRLFGVEESKLRVVRNGADQKFSQATPAAFVSRYGIRDFVLCPGRIEPRKNQLALLRAIQESDVPLVVLGDVVPGQEAYYAECRRAAGSNVLFLDAFEQTDPLLGSAYAACSCMALVSWFETPGLVALEAGMLGKPLVLGDRGSAREYFGTMATYVPPDDTRAIRRAVNAALRQSNSFELSQHVNENFNWRSIARDTSQAYAKLL